MNLRAIDRLVAEKVMGWKLVTYGTDKYLKRENGSAFKFEKWSPTNNITDAWKVVNKIKESRFSIRKRFITELQKEVTPKKTRDEGMLVDAGWVIFLLTPKAICLAALRTYGIDIDDIINNSDQKWFWTDEWQKEECEVEEQIKNGNITKSMSIEEALKHLNYLKGRE
jgi:hypothetical protein